MRRRARKDKMKLAVTQSHLAHDRSGWTELRDASCSSGSVDTRTDDPSVDRRGRKGEASTYLSATHPRAEGELDVLAAPHVHGVVEAADVMEVVLPHGDGAADECGRPVSLRLALQAPFLVRRHLHPHVPAHANEHVTSQLV